MHPPKKERIKHPEKAIMMFALITRTYGEAFPEQYKIKDIPEYKTNSFAKPSGVDENLAYIYKFRGRNRLEVAGFLCVWTRGNFLTKPA